MKNTQPWIPYFPQPVWRFGSVEIHAFGIAAAVALITGYLLCYLRARSQHLRPNLAAGIYLTGVAAGLMGGRLFGTSVSEGWYRVWNGQSGAGLVLGASAAGVACYIFLRHTGANPWDYFNVLAFATPSIWTLVRAGCALAHDHIGRPTSSFLGVQFPGGTRFDLGLLECLAAALISILWIILLKLRFRRFFPLVFISIGVTRLALIPFRQGFSREEWMVFGACVFAGIVLLRFSDQGTVAAKVNAR